MDFIYILLKAVVFIVQQIHEMMREILNNLSPSSATSSLFVIGDDVVLKVWWYHLNMGPLRNFALSCPDIQIGSERRGAHTGHRGEEGQWRFWDPTTVLRRCPARRHPGHAAGTGRGSRVAEHNATTSPSYPAPPRPQHPCPVLLWPGSVSTSRASWRSNTTRCTGRTQGVPRASRPEFTRLL